ncbi:MAG: putative toxin-antitoxin system toxin component, PIN family [Deltaproteobacteria bacterium]|nr:putative toxin-antitoxin system toxin component, PIN family [Deltaproteobacteria bacterium]
MRKSCSKTADECGFRHQGERAFLLARRRRFNLYTSVAILTETAQKLREKFNQFEDDIKEALKMISRAATVLKPAIHFDVLKDIPDNRILECAVEAAADLVVTGDRHLLNLRRFRGTPIIRLADFSRMFPED